MRNIPWTLLAIICFGVAVYKMVEPMPLGNVTHLFKRMIVPIFISGMAWTVRSEIEF